MPASISIVLLQQISLETWLVVSFQPALLARTRSVLRQSSIVGLIRVVTQPSAKSLPCHLPAFGDDATKE